MLQPYQLCSLENTRAEPKSCVHTVRMRCILIIHYLIGQIQNQCLPSGLHASVDSLCRDVITEICLQDCRSQSLYHIKLGVPQCSQNFFNTACEETFVGGLVLAGSLSPSPSLTASVVARGNKRHNSKGFESSASIPDLPTFHPRCSNQLFYMWAELENEWYVNPRMQHCM